MIPISLCSHLVPTPLLGNTDIITNSVVILFICDLDELLYGILVVISPRWVKSMTIEADDDSNSNSEETIQAVDNATLERKVANLENELRVLGQNMRLVLKHSQGMSREAGQRQVIGM